MTQLKKTGVVLLLLLVAGMTIVPCVSAENEVSDTDYKKQTDANYPIIVFEGSSQIERVVDASRDLNVPKTIKKFDVISIDMEKIRKSLKTGQQISIRIDGKPYKMNLREIQVNAEGVSPDTRSYSGFLNDVKNSEIVLTVSDSILIGRISIDNVDYSIDTCQSSDQKGSAKIIQYVYSSADVAEEGEYLMGDEYSTYLKNQLLSTKINDDDLTTIIPEADAQAVDSNTLVSILVMTDNQWITSEPDWQTKAQNIIAEANNQLTRSDIQVQLIATYDSSKRYELSNDYPNIINDPLGTFYSHVPASYLNGKSADIAIYLGGYDATCNAVGLAYGYDASSSNARRYAWAQMADDPSPHDAVHHDRAVVALHEIGHMFDADHQSAPGQSTAYNRAHEWTEWFIYTYQTVVYAPPMKSTRYEYSSDNYHGDVNHDNARRIYETRGVVANYVP
jgi:hypothetical protein